MKVQTVYCDSCNRCISEDNETPGNSYLVQPKIGEEGYLIDQEDIDLCEECFIDYKTKHPKYDIFRL